MALIVVAVCSGILPLFEMLNKSLVMDLAVKLSLTAMRACCSRYVFTSVVQVTGLKFTIGSEDLCKVVCPGTRVPVTEAPHILGLK